MEFLTGTAVNLLESYSDPSKPGGWSRKLGNLLRSITKVTDEEEENIANFLYGVADLIDKHYYDYGQQT